MTTQPTTCKCPAGHCRCGHAQPAGEQHTGTLNLTGEGQPQEAAGGISDATVVRAVGAYDEVPTYGTANGRRDAMRAALEAAAPAIRQQVAEEIAARLDGCYESVQRLAEENRQRSIDAGGRYTFDGDRFMRLAVSQKNRAGGLHDAATVAREIGGQR